MEGAPLGDFSSNSEGENWSVYKDALLPPPPTRQKPWHRAPVPASAPRLAGQKIWKKPNNPTLRSKNKEIDTGESQKELDRGGAGMRKKQRVLGEKTNIGDAVWTAVNEVEKGLRGSPAKGATSPVKGERTARKRTNMDRVITPRKPVRRVTRQTMSPVKIQSPLKLDLKQSPAKKVPLNDLDAEDAEDIPRRRKSLRRSSRRVSLALEKQKIGEQASTSQPDNAVRVFSGGVNFAQPVFVQESATAAHQASPQPELVAREITPTFEPAMEVVSAQEPEDMEPNAVMEEATEAIEDGEQENTFQLARDELMGNNIMSTSPSLMQDVESAGGELSTSNYPQDEPIKDVDYSSPTILDGEHSETPKQSPSAANTSTDLSEAEISSFALLDEEESKSFEESPVNTSADLSDAEISSHLPDDKELVQSIEEHERSFATSSTGGLQQEIEHLPQVPGLEQLQGQEQELLSGMRDSVHSKAESQLSEPSALRKAGGQEPSVLKSNERASSNESLPSKIPVTPKLTNRTPQRRGARRSTRITRASSVYSEDPAIQEAPVVNNLAKPLSRRSASPRKSYPKKQVPSRASLPQPKESFSFEGPVLPTLVLSSDRSASPKKISPKKQTQSPPPKMETRRVSEVVPTPPQDEMLEQVEDSASIPEEGHETRPHGDKTISLNENQQMIGSNTQLQIDSDSALPEAQGLLAEEANMTVSQKPMQTLEKLGSESAIRNDNNTPELEPIADSERNIAKLSDLSLHVPEDNIITSPSLESGGTTVDPLEVLEPIDVVLSNQEAQREQSPNEPVEELPETSTPDPTTTELVEAISENAPSATYDHADTELLRSFLTRVKANKAAKAETATPKRKRSLPHSPLRIPLDNADADDTNLSPSSPKEKDEFDVSVPTESPAKRRKQNGHTSEEDITEPRSIRRSGRTRLPVKTPLAAPSFIPVRRLGQEGGDNTIAVQQRSKEKELAALTRLNTRKNKGGALVPADVLVKKAEEKDDPASRQRALKEVFDENEKKQSRGKRGKNVVWAEELAQYQTADGKKVVAAVDKLPTVAEPEKGKETTTSEEKKKSSVPPKMKSKIALGMAANGTPAPKRKRGGRS